MKTKIIADLTSNHMGDMNVIESMIKTLAINGVDIVKVQSWQADRLRKDVNDYNTNYEYYLKHQLNDDKHWEIKGMCDKYKIQMLATCFDLNRVEYLSTLGLKTVKIASPDTASYKMINKALEVFDHVIISTGSTTKTELEKTIKLCYKKNVTFLHCVTIYPCPLNKVNMKRFIWLKDQGLRVGYSDHTLGTEAAKYAISLGAEYVEKHFTLNRELPGRDQKTSATIDEFIDLVLWCKLINKMRGKFNPSFSVEEKIFRQNYIGKWGDNA